MRTTPPCCFHHFGGKNGHPKSLCSSRHGQVLLYRSFWSPDAQCMIYLLTHLVTSWWFQHIWQIVVKTGSFPQVAVKIKNMWNHHPGPSLYPNSQSMVSLLTFSFTTQIFKNQPDVDKYVIHWVSGRMCFENCLKGKSFPVCTIWHGPLAFLLTPPNVPRKWQKTGGHL